MSNLFICHISDHDGDAVKLTVSVLVHKNNRTKKTFIIFLHLFFPNIMRIDTDSFRSKHAVKNEKLFALLCGGKVYGKMHTQTGQDMYSSKHT